jgi:hypothetical protein
VLPEHIITKAKKGIDRPMFISLLQNVGESHNVKILNKYIENVDKFKYLATK